MIIYKTKVNNNFTDFTLKMLIATNSLNPILYKCDVVLICRTIGEDSSSYFHFISFHFLCLLK